MRTSAARRGPMPYQAEPYHWPARRTSAAGPRRGAERCARHPADRLTGPVEEAQQQHRIVGASALGVYLGTGPVVRARGMRHRPTGQLRRCLGAVPGRIGDLHAASAGVRPLLGEGEQGATTLFTLGRRRRPAVPPRGRNAISGLMIRELRSVREQPNRIRLEDGSGMKMLVIRRQLIDEQSELIDSFLPIGEYGPYPGRLRDQFEG